MQFVRLNKQGVASDQGFVLQCVDRFAYEYREANRIMRLEGEPIVMDPGKFAFGFSFWPRWRDCGWQPPFDEFPVTDHDRSRIIQNIKDAMAFMGMAAEFE